MPELIVKDIVRHLRKSGRNRFRGRNCGVKYLVIHHAGDIPRWAKKDCYGFSEYCVSQLKMISIPQTYTILENGEIFLTCRPANAGHHIGMRYSQYSKPWKRHPLNESGRPRPTNDNSLGVMLLADLDKEPIGKVQYDSLVLLAKRLVKEYPGIIIIGHNNVPGANKLSCPGKHFKLIDFISDVKGVPVENDWTVPRYVNQFRLLKSKYADKLPDEDRKTFMSIINSVSPYIEDWKIDLEQ